MNESFTQTTIDLLRHGECEGGNIFRGSVDVRLSDTGLRQMHSAINTTNTTWNVIISSPLRRCHLFAEELQRRQSRHTACTLELNENIREIDFGDWEGQAIQHIEKTDGERFAQWRHNPFHYSAPNGETLESFKRRVSLALFDTYTRHAGKRVLWVTHGGVIRCVLSIVLGQGEINVNAVDVPYACLSRLQIYQSAEELPTVQLQAHNIGRIDT